jgi:hypothetical protein
MTARRSIWIGLACFGVFFVAFAPASLVSALLTHEIPGASVVDSRGTVWFGSARVNHAAGALGRVHWRFRPAGLLSLRVGYDVRLEAGSDRIDARVHAGRRSLELEAAGALDAAHLEAVLAPYGIYLPGAFTIDALRLVQQRGTRLPDVRGELRWSGGDVRYRLSETDHRAPLPPLITFIDSSAGQPEVSVYAVDDETPLILARIAQDGWVTIGITKRFTQLTGQPWHGEQPEHAVVVEVQEKLF